MTTPVLWIDVEDLFYYAHAIRARPSGIQRVAFEISRIMHVWGGDNGLVRFIRHDPPRNTFRTIEWSELSDLFSALSESAPPGPKRITRATSPHPHGRQFVRELVYRLPMASRVLVTDMLTAQEKAFKAWARLIAASVRGMLSLPRRLARRSGQSALPTVPSNDSFTTQAKPGDTLLTLGAPWGHPNYADLIEKHRSRFGLRYALVIHDIIPLRRPEWFDPGLVRLFRAYFDSVVPVCDTIFANSHFTAADVTAHAHTRGIALRGPIVPIPMGSGFGSGRPTTAVARTDRLPPIGSYVLLVSTIEARKNHALMFRVWRRLLEELPLDTVPSLVFAGHIGWLVEDLMRQIANADHLEGKLIVLEDPSDGELTALYQGCLFTVFPSLYEGWGLPVTESLAFGKPCLIADRTSLPEAGGDLARRFDPDNLNDAFAAVRDVILDQHGLSRWEEQVRREFRPVPWAASAEALLTTLGYAVTGSEVVESASPAMIRAEPGTVP
jgi:glycosyltransferase involved in cell wall biosynthesis